MSSNASEWTNSLAATTKLAEDGSNWLLYKAEFLDVIAAKGLKRYLVRSIVRPADYAIRVSDGAAILDDGTPVSGMAKIEREEEQDKYDQEAAQVNVYITRSVPQSLRIHLLSLDTPKERWERVCAEYEQLGALQASETRRKLARMHCGPDDDVRKHLEEMLHLRERLAGMGVKLTNEEFTSDIICSLGDSFSSLLSSVLTVARLQGKQIAPQDLIKLVIEQADLNTTHRDRNEDAEHAHSARGKPGGRGGTSGRGDARLDRCPICRGKHSKANCWHEGGGARSQAPDWFLEEERLQKQLNKLREKRNGSKKVRSADAHAADDSSDDSSDGYAFTATSNFAAVAAALSIPKGKRGAIVDSGASRHYSPEREKFITFRTLDPPRKILTAGGHVIQAIGQGDMSVDLPNGDKQTRVTLKDVLYAPKMAFTLLSPQRLSKHKYAVHIEDGHCEIWTPRPRHKIIARIPESHGLYRLASSTSKPELATVAEQPETEVVTINQLHRKMAHVNCRALERMVAAGLIEGITLDKSEEARFCEVCALTKAKRLPFPHREDERRKEYGGLVHTDVWGPARTEGLRHERYYVAFTDDSTDESRVFTMRRKSDVFMLYRNYEAWAKTQKGLPIKILRADRGGEYVGNDFRAYLDQQGTVLQLTAHDSPQQNGVAERLNGTIVNAARAMLVAADLPKRLWTYAIHHAVYIKNRSPTTANKGHPPYELANGRLPNIAYLPEFGDPVWVRLEKPGKLDARAEKCAWVGFAAGTKGSYVYWPKRGKVSTERNIVFNRDKVREAKKQEKKKSKDIPAIDTADKHEPDRYRLFDEALDSDLDPAVPNLRPSAAPAPLPPPEAERNPDPVPPPGDSDDESRSDDDEPPKGRGQRRKMPSAKARDILAGRAVGGPRGMRAVAAAAQGTSADVVVSVAVEELEPDEPHDDDGMLFAMAAEIGDSPTYKESLYGPEAQRWKEARDDEVKSLESKGVFERIERPRGVNVVGSKWVMLRKRNADGEISRYKARGVAQGFSQVEGVDYNETFAPVARLPSIRAILAYAAQNEWLVHHMDIKTAYLNAPLDKEIYMRPLPGCKSGGFLDEVWRLLRAIYGLKQSGRQWYMFLAAALIALGFVRSCYDRCVFFLRDEADKVIMAISTDDLTLAANRAEAMLKAKRLIASRFEVTDLGAITWLLGIDVRRESAPTISLGQTAYFDTILNRFGLQDAIPVSTPMRGDARLTLGNGPRTPEEKEEMAAVPYRQAIGALMYASVATRPDIAYAVAFLAQFVQNPGRAHWNAVKHVFRYLKGTRAMRLVLGGGAPTLVGYSDADWAQNYDRHSFSAYVFFFAGGAISWSSRKQRVVALSSTEAELIAVTEASKEGLWSRRFIAEIADTTLPPTVLYCDNQSALALCEDTGFHTRTKHIDVRYYFIRETIEHGLFSVVHCPTGEMIADIGTKSLTRTPFEHLRSLVGLRVE
jgi:hypothetical protein